MIQPLLIGIALVASFFGLLRTPPPAWTYNNGVEDFTFGATNFPTSLDSLTNPSGTDSVATVSHSGQHSNANDALEAIEAKVGINASTPVSGTVLAGTGSGTSIWTTYATTTNLTATGLGTFGGYISTASSTVIGNLNITGNSTTTNATTTNDFATNASSTNLFSTTFRGGGISTCSGSSFLQWSANSFGCASQTGITVFSTTTTANMATTTIRSTELPSSDNLIIKFMAPNIVGGETATTTSEVWMAFNYAEDTVKSNYAYAFLSTAGENQDVDINYVRLIRAPASGLAYNLRFAEVNITNLTGVPKTGTYNGMPYSTTTGAMNLSRPTDTRSGRFVWASTTKATNIVFWHSVGGVGGALFATGTQIIITGF